LIRGGRSSLPSFDDVFDAFKKPEPVRLFAIERLESAAHHRNYDLLRSGGGGGAVWGGGGPIFFDVSAPVSTPSLTAGRHT